MHLRRALLILVSLCLTFSQQAALAHGISHIKVMDDQARPAPTSFGKFATAAADEFCLECLAFAQVMGAACDTAVDSVTAAHPESELPDAIDRRVDSTAPLVLRARGPPSAR